MLATWGSTVAFIGYGAAKIVCISPLALASGSVAGAWLGAECLVLLAVRTARGQWRFSKPGADGVGVGLFTHFCFYLCMLGCPFTFLRVSTTFQHRIRTVSKRRRHHHTATTLHHHGVTTPCAHF